MAPAGIFLGMSGNNCWAITQTIAGTKVAGRWAGLQNFVGNFAGAVAPMLTGYLLGRTGQFYWPVVIAAVVSWISALNWVFAVGPIEPVDWEKKLGPARVISRRCGFGFRPDSRQTRAPPVQRTPTRPQPSRES